MRLVELKEIDDELLDESHAMTRMMLNAMGDRNPEATLKKHKEEAKRKKEAKKKKNVAEGKINIQWPDEVKSDKFPGDTHPDDDKCRGCGTKEPGARIDGLCKDCAKDTYDDRD